jgi:hypothetical protein
MRRHLARLHRRNFLDLTYSGVPFYPEKFSTHPISFADHESLGFYCQLAEPNHYVFKPYSEQSLSWGDQYHSWTQWSEKTKSELESLLAKP